MKFLRNIFIAAAAAAVCSCSFLDVEPSIISKETLYENEQDLIYGLAGVYGAINNEAFYGCDYSIYASNTDDLCYYNRASTNTYFPMYRYDATTAEIERIWTEIYHGVKNANAFMEAMSICGLESAASYANEARFIRAFYHFILAQAWGDVPLRDGQVFSPYEVELEATPQAQVLKWVAEEMTACIPGLPEELDNAPSRAVQNTAKGILARVYLFMAGATVEGDEAEKKEYCRLAMNYAEEVIDSGRHQLNPDYSEIFKNMISDKYDRTYYESMWEADFYGDRTSADAWTNGRIGDILGLQSSGASDFMNFTCNFAYGQFNGSLKLWDLYWTEDRTEDEDRKSVITDDRQEWNLPPYNYAGNAKQKPYDWTEGDSRTESRASYDKTPYVYGGKNTRDVPTAAPAIRNAGKFRREAEYEGHKGTKSLYTGINFPILRYSDILLMYAEAYNEYNGAPSQEAYDYVVAVRERAGIKTKDYAGNYDSYLTFQEFVRNERGRELCFEALRKYDLIRWGIFVEEMNNYRTWADDTRWKAATQLSGLASSIGQSVQEKHIVMPIPSIELGVNKKLTQHPLW